MSIHKTNAARLLDKAKIPYELITYQVDENDLSASHLAEQLQLPAGQLFKTILLRGDKSGIFVAVVPGDQEVNLKLAAAASGNKKAETVPLKELLPLTGYIRGGCSPIGMKKNYPVYLDQQVEKFTLIFLSAGQRGLQFKMDPQDLVKAVNGIQCDLTGTPEE